MNSLNSLYRFTTNLILVLTLVLLLMLLLLPLSAFAQPMGMGRSPHEMGMDPFGREMFFCKVYNFADRGDFSLSKAEIHFSFVNDVLTFIRTDEHKYRAKYELGVTFYNEKGEPVGYRTENNEILVDDFEETNSRQTLIRHEMSLSLPPGDYDYLVQLLDADAKQILQRKASVELRDFSRTRLHLSDIVFADEVDCQSVSPNFTPNLRDVFDNAKSAFAAYFEVYPPTGSDKVSVDYRIYNSVNKPVFSGVDVYVATESTIPKCFSFRDSLNKPGEYVLALSARTGSQVANLQRKFFVHWGNARITERNIDAAVEQLDLIAKGAEFEQIKNATGEERKASFDEFWQKRDPTPGTPRNELKEEFFRRVDFANQSFTELRSGREGWRTDRGHVYITNGPPDEVERQPTDMNMPSAEIWYYAKLNRRYIFSDRNGSGEYRLVKVE